MAGVPNPCEIRLKWVKQLWIPGSRMGCGREFPKGERSWESRSVNSLQICLEGDTMQDACQDEANYSWRYEVRNVLVRLCAPYVSLNQWHTYSFWQQLDGQCGIRAMDNSSSVWKECRIYVSNTSTGDVRIGLHLLGSMTSKVERRLVDTFFIVIHGYFYVF